MKAVISAHSGIEGLEVRDIPVDEKLGPHDVRMKVHAFGLNWRDYFKMTRIPWCRENPIPGSDASGEVVAVGEEVTRFKVGDKVITSKYSGTEVKVDGEEYTIVRQSDILAVIE